jgi:hypothetical protein
MAYFNTKLAKSRELHPIDIYILQLIHQNKSDDMSEDLILIMDDDSLKRLNAFELMDMIKGSKKMNDFQKLRLTKKGKKWLTDFQTYSIVENDIKLFDTLKEIYTDEAKEIGSEKKTKELIAWFRNETGFNHRQIWLIAKKFVQDEDRMMYSKVLQFAFWKSTNHFQVKPKLEDSKMYSYFEKHREWFNVEFKKLKK